MLVPVLGVLGIIFGILSIVSNVLVGATMLHWLPRKAPPPPRAAPAPVVSIPVIPPAPPGPVPTPPHPKPFTREVLGPRGLPARDRAVAIAAVQRVRPLLPREQTTLDLLLREKGADMFGDAPLTPNAAADAIVERPAPNPPPRRPLAWGVPIVLGLHDGQLTITEDRAEFTPNGGKRVAIFDRTIYGSAYISEDGARRVSDGEIQAAMDRIHQTFGRIGLNPRQAGAFVDACRAIPLPTEMLGASAGEPGASLDNRTLEVRGVAGSHRMWIDATGRVLLDPPLDYDPLTFARRPPAPPPPRNPLPGVSAMARGLSPAQVCVMLVEAALSALAGVLLLVAGRMILADSPRAARLAVLYGEVGLALSVLGAGFRFAWSNDLYGQIGLPAMPFAANLIASVVGLLISASIPLALLLTFWRRRPAAADYCE